MHSKQSNSNSERGQAILVIVLAMSIFVIAAMAFSVDYTNLWFHRQKAQAAADAACLAGAMDLMMESVGASSPCTNPGHWGCFTPGTGGTCGSTSRETMCKYAGFNGYSGGTLDSTQASNSVVYSFPSSVSGVSAPPSSVSAHPFLQVQVQEYVKDTFSPMITRRNYELVGASSTCGLTQVYEGAPLMVLNPTVSGALTYSGGAKLTIVGGPPRSIVVNSSSSTAVLCQPSGLIDTSTGGPNRTGSDVGTFGGPQTPPNSSNCPGSAAFNGGSTGNWVWPATPVPDPYAGVPAPAGMASVVPITHSSNGYFQIVAHDIDGCPDNSPTNYYGWSNPHSGCIEYAPGYYPSGISQNANDVVMFLPGVYYMDGDLSVGGSDTIRMAKPCANHLGAISGQTYCSTAAKNAGLTWHQTDGVMFYFHNNAKVVISGASGGPGYSRVDKVPSTDLTCDGSTPPSYLGLASGLDTDVLQAECTRAGTYYDSANDTSDATGSLRGLLMFYDHGHGTGSSAQPQLQGSGTLAFTGTMYFHTTSYGTIFQVPGGTSTGTLIWGNIVTDRLNMSGSGALKMALNPSASTALLKVGLFK